MKYWVCFAFCLLGFACLHVCIHVCVCVSSAFYLQRGEMSRGTSESEKAAMLQWHCFMLG